MRCLIIDDESNSRHHYRLLGHWAQHGIDEIYEASCSQTALEIVHKHRPEIILTDMCMAPGDGVEFLQELQNAAYTPQIIVISGYTDFQYMQSAVKYHAMDYLLKPVNEQHFNEVLAKAVAEYRASQEAAQASVDLFFSRASDHLVRTPLEEHFLDLKVVQEFVAKHRYFGLCMPLILNFEEACQASGCLLPDLLCFRTQRIMEASIRKAIGLDVLVLHVWDGIDWSYLCLLGGETQEALMDFSQLTQGLRSTADSMAKLNMRVIWGYTHTAFCREDFSYKYQQLRNQLFFLPFTKSAKIMKTQDSFTPPDIPRVIYARSREITIALHTCRPEEVLRIVQEGYNQLTASSSLCVKSISQLSFDLMEILREVLIQNEAPSEKLAKLNRVHTSIYNVLDRTPRQMELLKNCIEDVCAQTRTDAKKQIITEILLYIEQNYAQRITLSMLSKYFYTSREHLCRIIAQETGKTFSEHLLDIRLKNAVRLLQTTQLSIMQVASSCGFSDASHMNRSFQKVYHTTPSAIRAANEANQGFSPDA